MTGIPTAPAFPSLQYKFNRKLAMANSYSRYNEFETLIKALGYKEVRAGKTSGSGRAFILKERKHIIRLHKPHPGSVMKMYQIDYIINELKKKNLL